MSDILTDRASSNIATRLRATLSRAVTSALTAGSRIVSISYLFLRATTAVSAIFAALVQTFVFARVLSPQQFSVFILLASFGVSMNLLDFGVVKLFFVRLRGAFLSGSIGAGVAAQSTAIVVLYGLFVAICVLACAAVFSLTPAVTPWATTQYTLFFLFAALNLLWFALRNISVAVDEYIYFESLEATRRIGGMALTLVMLLGFPLMAFNISVNILWAVVLSLSVMRLVKRKAMILSLKGVAHNLRMFYWENRHAMAGTSIYATTEIYVYAFPYVVVSTFFGLGAPTIILDTTLKILRGASLLYGAACDLMVPRQTKAFAQHEPSTLVRATWMAVLFCGLPAAALCGILLISADGIFAVLLGPAAVMPAAAAPVLVVLLLANLTQMVSHSLLVHTGFFNQIAKLGVITAAAMTAATALAIVSGADIVGFLKVYTGIYTCGALISVVLVLRGPIHSVRA